MQSIGKVVEKIFTPRFQNEGVGARVMRIIGGEELGRLDPFLMLDYFFVKLPAGFPDHPHRGFETVTYMKTGKFYHEDFKGHRGVIGPGDIQWMTAGKGIVHSEMPASFDETSIGFQLWLNLEKKNKLIPAAYQEYTADKIPRVEKEGVVAHVIAGEALGVKGPIVARTPAFYVDFDLAAGKCFEQLIPPKWNSFCYVYEGDGVFGADERKCVKDNAVLLKNDENEKLVVKAGTAGLKFILLAGLPLGEPIVQHGPFVMNEQSEIRQAMIDYSNSNNGFEGAQDWESEIQNLRDPGFHKKYVMSPK